LNNIAWLTIRRNAMFFGGKMPNFGPKSLFDSDYFTISTQKVSLKMASI
jgi:hypothetical protein